MLRIFFTLLILYIAVTLPAFCAIDSSMVLISKQELASGIQQTPLQSPENGKLISRAAASHLTKEAYDQYTLLWQKHPNDPYANLRRGVAAKIYWEYATKPDVNQLPLGSQQASRIRNAAASCLEKAIQLMPKSATANAEYGDLLFYQGYMDKGVALMKTAITIDPKATVAYELLGEVYSSPNPPYYKPKLAEEELNIATQLAPTDSYPYWVLARLHAMTGQYKQAQKDLNAYLALVPASIAQESWIKRMKTNISSGLNHS